MAVIRDRRDGTDRNPVNNTMTDMHLRQKEVKQTYRPLNGAKIGDYIDSTSRAHYSNLFTPDNASASAAFTPDEENPQVTTDPGTSNFHAETDNDYLDSGDWHSQ